MRERVNNNMLLSVLQFIVAAAVPIILTVLAVRLVMSPLFLQFEYNRPNFPQDPFGFTTEDRLQYAPPAVEYLLNNSDISYLADLRLPREIVPRDVCIVDPENENLCYQFNERELRHMEDVKVVTQGTYLIGIGVSILGIIGAFLLARMSPIHLRIALTGGSILTVGIIGTIILLSLTAWDAFFTGFHQVFFEGDSWLFRYSDTLIRLFPEQFWFDAAILIGSLVFTGAILIFIATWYWGHFYLRSKQEMIESNHNE